MCAWHLELLSPQGPAGPKRYSELLSRAVSLWGEGGKSPATRRDAWQTSHVLGWDSRELHSQNTNGNRSALRGTASHSSPRKQKAILVCQIPGHLSDVNITLVGEGNFILPQIISTSFSCNMRYSTKNHQACEDTIQNQQKTRETTDTRNRPMKAPCQGVTELQNNYA